jgi:2',3'-cyclic-nucleotide 2'-phosphodiesterase (5'-nucleotidase family)
MNIKAYIFKRWLDNQHYNIAANYRAKLQREIDIAKYYKYTTSPMLVKSLKEIEMPKYDKYTGTLTRNEQFLIFNQQRKINKQAILQETLKELATYNQQIKWKKLESMEASA